MPAAATSSPVSRLQRCAATVVEPMSTAMPKARSWKPGQTPMICDSPCTATVTFQPPLRSACLQFAEHREVAVEAGELPFGVERVLQPPQVARRILHVRFLHLDEVQAHDRVQLDFARIGVLAHDLAVHLAARRHVDDHVALHARRAGEAMSRWQCPCALA